MMKVYTQRQYISQLNAFERYTGNTKAQRSHLLKETMMILKY